MKKWVWWLIGILVVLAICCGIGAFVFYKFFQKATAPRSAYEQVEVGQTRQRVEDLMGGNGLPSDNTKNPPAGTDCRSWVDRDSGKQAFEICFADGVVSTKTEYKVN